MNVSSERRIDREDTGVKAEIVADEKFEKIKSATG